MKKIQVAVLTIIALSILAVSCSKKDNNLAPQTGQSQETREPAISPTGNDAADENQVIRMDMTDDTAARIGGEDDDEPIIMHLSLNIKGWPVAGTQVTFISGTDTLVRYANLWGQSFFRLPRRGSWAVDVTKAGYTPIHNSVNVNHPRNLKVNILKQQ